MRRRTWRIWRSKLMNKVTARRCRGAPFRCVRCVRWLIRACRDLGRAAARQAKYFFATGSARSRHDVVHASPPWCALVHFDGSIGASAHGRGAHPSPRCSRAERGDPGLLRNASRVLFSRAFRVSGECFGAAEPLSETLRCMKEATADVRTADDGESLHFFLFPLT